MEFAPCTSDYQSSPPQPDLENPVPTAPQSFPPASIITHLLMNAKFIHRAFMEKLFVNFDHQNYREK